MNSFSFNSDILHVENVSLVKISKNVGTPLYVYSKKQFQNNYNLLTSSLNKTLGKKYDILISTGDSPPANIFYLIMIKFKLNKIYILLDRFFSSPEKPISSETLKKFSNITSLFKKYTGEKELKLYFVYFS